MASEILAFFKSLKWTIISFLSQELTLNNKFYLKNHSFSKNSQILNVLDIIINFPAQNSLKLDIFFFKF